MGEKFRTQNARHPCIAPGRIGGCGQVKRLTAAVPQPKCHRRDGQRQPLDGAGDMTKLGGFSADEFPPRGHVIEQFAYFDGGALWMRRRLRRRRYAAFHLEFCCGCCIDGPAADAQARH